MPEVMYNNTVLKGMNKGGVLKPDEKGYYTVVLGALGVTNSCGEVYVDSPEVRQSFEENGMLMRRINQGLLRGEYGHPDPDDYPNSIAFEMRIRKIKEDRVSHHISSIWLEKISYNGEDVMAILGKVKPTGPYGQVLKDALDNPDENVTFSGRYYSNVSKSNGKLYRSIHTVGTWDYVSEPGISVSQKYLSPALESLGRDIEILPQILQKAMAKESRETALSVESGGVRAKELYQALGFGKSSSWKDISW